MYSYRMKKDALAKGIVLVTKNIREAHVELGKIEVASGEYAIVECDGTFINDILRQIPLGMAKSMLEHITQKGVPLVQDGDKLAVKFSFKKAITIANEKKFTGDQPWQPEKDPQKLTDTDRAVLEKLAIAAVAKLEATNWDESLKAAQRAAKAEKDAAKTDADKADSVNRRLKALQKDAAELGITITKGNVGEAAAVQLPASIAKIVEKLMPFAEDDAKIIEIFTAIATVLAPAPSKAA